MSSKKFWKLSFYDWSLWIQRIKTIHVRRKEDKELLIELERNSMALLANLNTGKSQAAYSGTDFYKLSYDQKSETSKATGEEMFKFLNEKFKDKPIRKRGR